MNPVAAALNIQIEQLEGVYTPTTDSMLLHGAFAEHGPAAPAAVLDLCCGSGIQGIAAALRGHRVDAVDADRSAVISTRRNALLNGVQVEARHGDLFAPFAGCRYDEILVNPPYVPTPEQGDVSRFRWSDGGRDGRLLIDRICREAGAMLHPGGALWLVQSSLAGTEETVAQLKSQAFEVESVEEHEEPFGPISLERLQYLRANGFALAGDDAELLTVLRAARV